MITLTPPLAGRGRAKRRAAAVLLALAAAGAGCDRAEREATALAVACIRAADDNRVKLSATWLSDAQIELDGDLVTVRTEVPVGLSIKGRVRFRRYEYRCRRRDGGLEFLGYDVSSSWLGAPVGPG